jgi:CPA1 family monovalent cation:H+ antiporter
MFLAVIFVASLFSSKTRIPYTMMLVGIGILFSILSLFPAFDKLSNFSIDPKLILDFMIPPLIFEAMMKMDYEAFKKVRLPALMMATVGVVVATVVGGLLLTYFANIPVLVAFAFAALIAPTDAAIVIDIFKRVKLPHLLSALMETESSFNDATGIIVFSLIASLAFGGEAASTGSSTLGGTISLDIAGAAGHFAIVFFGGAAIGLGIAAGAYRLHALVDDPFSETVLTVATVFGAMILSNAIGVSGLVAVAVAGLFFGSWTLRRENVVSQRVRQAAFGFWEMAAFLANSAAFLYLGVTLDVTKIANDIPLIILAFGAVLAARAASTYSIISFTNRITRFKIPLPWKHAVVLGGMRGAVSVALVASLPEGPFKNTLETVTYGVVLSSLVIQYIALSRYTRKAFSGHAAEEPERFAGNV